MKTSLRHVLQTVLLNLYQYYLRYKTHRRLRLAKGEYFFHQMMKGLWFTGERFSWLEDGPIQRMISY